MLSIKRASAYKQTRNICNILCLCLCVSFDEMLYLGRTRNLEKSQRRTD